MLASFPKRIRDFLRQHWRLLLVLGIGLASYTVAGFLLVPRLAKSFIEQYVEKDLSRRVSIGALTFNPYSLTAEIRAFALTEANGSPIASFDLFRLKGDLRSIFYRAWTFKEVSFDRPSLHVQVNADGSLNLARLSGGGSAPAQASSAPPVIPAVRVGSLAIRNGLIVFNDLSRSRPFAVTLTPVEISLNDFRTAADFQNAYRLEGSTQAGERLAWSGRFTVQPLSSMGNFSIGGLKASTVASYLQDALPFGLSSGSLDLTGNYRVAIADPIKLAVDFPTIKLRDLGIAAKGGDQAAPLIAVPEITITNSSAALPDRKLAVERVDVSGAKLGIYRDADGALNLQQLMPAQPANAPAPTANAPVSGSPPPAWSATVGKLSVQAAAIDFEDRTTQPAAKLSLAPLAATVSGYSTDPGKPIALAADIGIDAKGRVTAKGNATLTPIAVNLEIDANGLDLPWIQPYLAQKTGMELTSGQFAAVGKVSFAASPENGAPALKLSGELTVSDFATLDGATHQDFIKWQQLRLLGVEFQQEPDQLAIERIEVRRPYGRVTISAEQNLNVAAILNPHPAPADAPRESARPTTPSGTAATMPVSIGQVAIDDGAVNFADYSVTPNFAAAIVGLHGTVKGLTSAPKSRATIKLSGNVGRYAPVNISGAVNIFSASVFTDIAMNFRNIELTTFNPYSGKYAGYKIAKGKLATDLHYKIQNRKLDAEHHIVLDHLEFGEATNSRDAVPLPVRLAVSLLKDSNGMIDLNLPVGGRLDDPSFRLGPIIWQAFTGLIGKIVTAPFALLGSLFGGGADLEFIDFPAGSAVLQPDQQDKLAKVATALTQRPGLKIDVPLQAVSPADDPVLAASALETAVTAAQPSAGSNKAAGPEQRLGALEMIYGQQFGAAPAYPRAMSADAKEVDAKIVFLEGALRPKFTPTTAQRDALGRTRAEAVQAILQANPGIAPDRVFLVDRLPSKTDASVATRMELSLE